MVGFKPLMGNPSAPPPIFPPARTTPSPNPHQAIQSRSYGVPSPPRVYVPPPAVTDTGSPNLEFVKRTGRDFESNGFANSDFLKTVTYGHFTFRDHVLEWEYEERRVAQEILPFIWLGPVSAARDRQFLINNQITMVMAVRDTLSAQAKLLCPKAPGDLGIHSVNIDVRGNQQLIAAFPRAIEAINSHLSSRYQIQQAGLSKSIMNGHLPPPQPVPGKVLVFCESGNERSVAVVVAYIMAMYSTTLVEALQVVQSQRFCISVNDASRYLLNSYADILRAKRDVTKSMLESDAAGDPGMDSSGSSNGISNGTSNGHSTLYAARSTKRSLDDAYEDEMEIDDEGGWNNAADMARFDKREGLAPFIDRSE